MGQFKLLSKVAGAIVDHGFVELGDGQGLITEITRVIVAARLSPKSEAWKLRIRGSIRHGFTIGTGPDDVLAQIKPVL